MADTAELVIKLTDKVSGPANKIARSMRGMTGTAAAGQHQLANASGVATKSMTSSFAMGELLGNVYIAIGQTALAAAAAIGRFALDVVVGFTRALAGAVMFLERMRKGFGALFGAGGAAALQDVIDMSAKLGLDIEDTVAKFRELAALGFAPQVAKDIIRMSADLRALGVSAEKADALVGAMAKARSMGRMPEAEALASAGLSQIAVLEQLAKITGKTVEQTRALAEAGKITGDQFVAAMQAVIKAQYGIKQFGDVAAGNAKTLGGAAAIIRSTLMAKLYELADKVLPHLQAAFGPVLRGVIKVLESPAAGKAVDALATGVRVVASVMGILGRVGLGFLKGFIAGLTEAGKGIGLLDMTGKINPQMLRQMVADMTAFGRAVGKVLGYVLQLVDALRNLGGAGGTKEPFSLGKATGTGAGTDPFAFVQSIVEFVRGLVPQLSQVAMGAGGGLIDGLVQGILSGVSRVVSAIQSMASSAIAAVTSAFQLGSPSRLFAQFGAMTGEGFEQGLTGSRPGIDAAAAGMLDPRKLASRGGGTVNARATSNATITIPGSADPQATAQAVRDVLVTELAGAFEQLSIQVAGGP